jgi:hypothetical protein
MTINSNTDPDPYGDEPFDERDYPTPTPKATGTTATLSVLPRCWWCPNTAAYDFRTKQGPWAYGCIDHYQEHRMHGELGVGRGQLLLLAKS